MPHYTSDGVFLRSNRGAGGNPLPLTPEEQARTQRRAEAMCAARTWYEAALPQTFTHSIPDMDCAVLVTPAAPVFEHDDSVPRRWALYVRFDPATPPASPVDGEYAGAIVGAEPPSLWLVERAVTAWLEGCE